MGYIASLYNSVVGALHWPRVVDDSASCAGGKGIVAKLTEGGSEGIEGPIDLAGVVTLLEENAAAQMPWQRR